MYSQNGSAFALRGKGYLHLPVEAAGAQQRWVEYLGTVGGGDHDHAGGRVEPIHLGQHLVEGLVPLVVGNDLAAAALPDRVDLVDEHDCGRSLAGVGEQVADPRGADAYEHLYEAGTG